jgi:hypothetical protein|tara:strand:- start:1418 stop:1600 length:183 start_codon:yes stop_codon:yes gene_type:complete
VKGEIKNKKIEKRRPTTVGLGREEVQGVRVTTLMRVFSVLATTPFSQGISKEKEKIYSFI